MNFQFNNMKFPFNNDGMQFSALNYALAQSTPADSLNILWNLNNMKLNDSILYMNPPFNPSIGYEYPMFGLYGNNLLDPMLAMQQALQNFQNNSWSSNIGGGLFNNMPFLNNTLNPFVNNNSNNNNNNSNNNSTESEEYKALKAVITKYKEIETQKNNLSPELKDKIDAALNKSGTAEEKMTALKEVYTKLNSSKLKRALLDLPEYKDILSTAGYKLDASTNKDKDAELKKELNSMETNIKTKKGDKLFQVVLGEDNPNVLRIVSYWNDTHSDNDSRSIIRLVANNLPSAKEEQEMQKKGIHNLAMSLINKADEFRSELNGDCPKLVAAKEEVSKALSNAEKENQFTTEYLMKLSDKFDVLYAMLRMMEAEQIRNSIQTKYGFLNNISQNDTDFVTDDLIMKETKEDLAAEGITIVETDPIEKEEDDEIHEPDSYDEKDAEANIGKLFNKGHLKKTSKEGVYEIKTSSDTGEATRLYTIKDDKIVELEGVKSIDKDGKCTMTDGSEKELADVTTREVKAEEIDTYNTTIKRVNKLISDEKLIKSKVKLDGHSLYISKGKKENGYKDYYIVKDNKLMKIDCLYVGEGGTIYIDKNSTKKYSELEDSDFTVVSSDSSINTVDKTKKEEEKTETPTEEGDKKPGESDSKEKQLPKIKQSDIDMGTEIADKLMGNTNNTAWTEAKELILGVEEDDNYPGLNADNIRGVIYGYSKKEGFGTDNILEQIATEQKDGFWTMFKQDKFRDSKERLAMINKIIKAVLDYCAKNNKTDSTEYEELKKAYNDGKGIKYDGEILPFTDKDHHCSKFRKLDQWILKLLEIDKITSRKIEKEEE